MGTREAAETAEEVVAAGASFGVLIIGNEAVRPKGGW